MKTFSYVGRLMASKSILNRLLIAQSYSPNLKVRGDSLADDVLLMKESLLAFHQRRPMNAGLAGTVLRFMALRASREPGRHVIKGHPRLFERPQAELKKILNQLGVDVGFEPDALWIEGQGWKLQGDTLIVPFDKSSQFASAVLLNCWQLPFDLFVACGSQKISESYWRMTVRLMQRLGMQIDFWDQDFRVPRAQSIQVDSVASEIDLSSAFNIAALAAVAGSAVILDFPVDSLQPDIAFVGILQSMGVPVKFSEGRLQVNRADRLNGLRANLGLTPDLFPVLAALCGLAQGESELYGAPQLVHKESNRLERMAEILRALGRSVQVRADGLLIGGSPTRDFAQTITVDCDHDHRLAFAAGVLKAAGVPVRVLGGDVVSKSFPDFWSLMKWD